MTRIDTDRHLDPPAETFTERLCEEITHDDSIERVMKQFIIDSGCNCDAEVVAEPWITGELKMELNLRLEAIADADSMRHALGELAGRVVAFGDRWGRVLGGNQ